MLQRPPYQPSALKPFKHQLEIFEKTRDMAGHALLLEMGTGKSRIVIDTVAWLFAQGEIDALLVVAPNGVHANWLSDELPKHLHPSVKCEGHCYSTAKYKTVTHKDSYERMIHSDGLAVLCISYDAFITDHGKAAVKRFLTSRKCFYVLDESTRIKNPSAIRTKTILASARYAEYRRILTGTPVTNGPFDIFSQMKFLDPVFWVAHGFASFTVFKQYFGIFTKMTNPNTGSMFDSCVGYRNLPVLARILQHSSSRVLKSEVLDLPPKVYTKRYYEMTGPQATIYRQMRDDFIATLESGVEVTAALAIVRLMRLQQIASGWMPVEQDDGKKPLTMFSANPRLDCLTDTLEDIPGQVLIWSRFTQDINLICDKLKGQAVRYDGSVSDSERQLALQKFHDGEATYFVANPAAAGEGLTLTEAKTVIYYNNSFKLAERQQSEDRAHRIGQTDSVTYIDIVCSGTIDEHVAECLVTKADIACQLTGDKIKKWL